eukprot:4141167-Amphidinium_carterae.1
MNIHESIACLADTVGSTESLSFVSLGLFTFGPLSSTLALVLFSCWLHITIGVSGGSNATLRRLCSKKRSSESASS